MTLLGHYWRPDDPVELTAAIGRDWADVLEGLPQDAIQKACIQFQRENGTRKPTPGAIYQAAQKFIIRPKPVEAPEPERKKISQEQASAILSEAGIKVDENGRVVGL